MAVLEGRVAIVTGAGQGIGRAQALALAAAGAKVVVNDLADGAAAPSGTSSQSPADATAEAIRAAGGTAAVTLESVADWAGAKRVVQIAVDTYGGLDILVNNAGIVWHRPFDETTEDEFDTLIAVNLKGTFAMCRHALAHLRASRHGRIINTASNQWAAPIGKVDYAASKGGVVSLTYALAGELLHEGIMVNAIAPFAATPATANVAQTDAANVARGILSERRLQAKEPRTDPSHVPPIVVYLASDAGAGVTGLVFRTGGGKLGSYTHPVEGRTIFRDVQAGPWSYGELAQLLPRTLLQGETRAPHLL